MLYTANVENIIYQSGHTEGIFKYSIPRYLENLQKKEIKQKIQIEMKRNVPMKESTEKKLRKT